MKPSETQDPGAIPERTFKILIVDDVATDRMRLRRMLLNAGLRFELHEAETLAVFREKIAQTAMDVVFLDYNLGVDTGLDALTILLAHEKQAGALPIMVTGVDRCDLAVEAMRAGCADYLIKDQMTVESIRKSVAAAFERRILASALAEAQQTREAVLDTVERLSAICGPDIRAVLAATLRHARSLRGQPGLSEGVARHLRHVERGCHDISDFLSSVVHLLEQVDAQRSDHAERVMAR